MAEAPHAGRRTGVEERYRAVHLHAAQIVPRAVLQQPGAVDHRLDVGEQRHPVGGGPHPREIGRHPPGVRMGAPGRVDPPPGRDDVVPGAPQRDQDVGADQPVGADDENAHLPTVQRETPDRVSTTDAADGPRA